MSSPVLRQRIPYLVQHVPIGLLSVLPISTSNKRQYALNFSKLNVNRLMERKIAKNKRLLSGGIVKSPLGSCEKIPNQNLVEYVYKNIDKWIEEPAAVCLHCLQ